MCSLLLRILTVIFIYYFDYSVHGGWSGWSNVGSCSKTCGGGVQLRRRSCNNPAPYCGGGGCLGSAENRVPCNNGQCPGKLIITATCHFYTYSILLHMYTYNMFSMAQYIVMVLETARCI